MTSLELVDYINEGRREKASQAGKTFPSQGHSELSHDNFLKKVKAHPGVDWRKFLRQYKDRTGRSVNCYHLPEREARLMVMAESLEVQTKVLDRLMAMEPKALQTLTLTQAKAEVRAEVEHDYRENLKHHPYFELGAELMRAVRMQEFDSTRNLEEILDGIDFVPAARSEGKPVEVIRDRVAAKIQAQWILGKMVRGEHEDRDTVRDVVAWAKSMVNLEDTRARIAANRKQEALQRQSLHQLLANDMREKYDSTPIPAPKKRGRPAKARAKGQP